MDWMAINGGRNGMGKVANRNDQSREREDVCGVVCGVWVDKNWIRIATYYFTA